MTDINKPSDSSPTSLYPDVTGVILAGGRSKRMGQDKAQLLVSGQTLFTRMLELMQGLFSDVIIAGDRSDLSRPGVPSIPDIYPGSALGGIHTGLVTAKTDWVFIAPCDMPYPDQRVIESLLLHRDNHDAVVPQTPAGFEPVFALYHKNCLKQMESMLEQDQFRIYTFYQNIDIHFLTPEHMPEDWQRSLLNLNTPEDLAVLEKINK